MTIVLSEGIHVAEERGTASIWVRPHASTYSGHWSTGGLGFDRTGNGFSIVVRANTVEKTGLYVQQLGSRDRALVRPTQGRGAVVASGATGVLLFMRENALLAQRMNLDDLRLEGERERA
ncbi:MAG: hypothetical protein AB7I50_23645 [Vicinamibacterales bacterium]